ncbi:MAG: DUF3576 domain-containing protein [Alphaproteobacteria bacterium]
MHKSHFVFGCLAVLVTLSLAACSGSGVQSEARYPTGADRSATGGDIYAKPDSVFGEGGIGLFGSRKREEADETGVGVNAHLWRAALDTVSFMPLASADPFGGVILTDWYSTSENANERYKLNVFIMGRQLRSDGVRVRVFRQDWIKNEWVDVESSQETARQLENTILNRARQLRAAS